MPGPISVGSYREDDVSILLTDLSSTRHGALNGRYEHSSRAVPAHLFPLPEYQPTASYLATIPALIASSADRVALLCAALAELILGRHGPELVIVSIARAGTPVGVLLKRWIRYCHGQVVPHYSVSVANGAGLDVNAVSWLCRRHNPDSLQFVDAWTSKGTISNILKSAVSELHIPGLDPSLAVLADIASCTDLFATREDVLIPHACLGATMSGLLSRPFVNPQLKSGDGFHAVISYSEWAKNDLSNIYIEMISSRYPKILEQVPLVVQDVLHCPQPDKRGMREAFNIARRYGAVDFDLVNIGTSESTRAFLRRTPRLLLVDPYAGEQIMHLLQLAHERNVPVRQEPGMPFRAALL